MNDKSKRAGHVDEAVHKTLFTKDLFDDYWLWLQFAIEETWVELSMLHFTMLIKYK